jgi:hypothetical protein
MTALIDMLPVDSEEYLIVHIVEAVATWQFWVHLSISSALLLAVYWGRWPYVWTCALNWYEIQFFLEYLSGFAWFITLGRLSHVDGLWHCKTTCPTHRCLTVNLCFGPTITSQNLGMEVSFTLCTILPHSHSNLFSVTLYLILHPWRWRQHVLLEHWYPFLS